jgi:hypothetical protein
MPTLKNDLHRTIFKNTEHLGKCRSIREDKTVPLAVKLSKKILVTSKLLLNETGGRFTLVWNRESSISKRSTYVLAFL